MREAHLLTKTRGNDTPYNWIFFDCETFKEYVTPTKTINRLKLGVARYYHRTKESRFKFQRECVFDNSEMLGKFIDKVLRSKTNVIMVSHNLTFDFLAGRLFYVLPEHGFKISSFYKKGMTSIFNYNRDESSLTAIDSGNFFTTSLEAIGKMVGRPKDLVDFDTISDEDLLSYCRNDVLILVEAMEHWLKFLRENNLGGFRLTIASTAMNVFRRNFMKYEMYLHSDVETINLERESYHGGRVETYYVGYFNSQMYYQLDVNSMYPYICKVNKFPVKWIKTIANPGLLRLEEKLKSYACIAKVTLKTDETPYPLLHESRLFYPVGEFTTTLTTPELQYALEHNHIIKVHNLSIYQQFNIFDAYMTYFYEKRLQYRADGNEIFDKICKLFGNGLYGKWGARDIKTERIGDNHTGKVTIEPDYDAESGQRYDWWFFPDSIFKTWQEEVAYNAFPAIASHVTAYGRMMNYGFTKQANRENVYYTDTDGLWVNSLGFQRLYSLIDDTKLGALKIEDTSSFLDIKSPKDYSSEHKNKSKGIRKSAIKLADNVYEQDKFSSLNGMMRNQTLDGVFIEKTIKHNYNFVFSGYPTSSGQILPPIAFLLPNGIVQVQGLTPTGFHSDSVQS